MPSERHLSAGPIEDSAKVSAVRAFDELAPKARQMCGGGAPVVFTAVDWGIPRTIADEVELSFVVHGGKRLCVRLAREKAARVHEALALILSPS